MQKPRPEADRLLEEVCRAILDAGQRAENEWASLAFVLECEDEPDVAFWGYAFREDGHRPFIVRADDFPDLARDFRDASGGGWRQALIWIRRSDLKMEAFFEHNELARWRVSPATLEEDIEAIRPTFANE